MKNAITWFEIPSADYDRATTFYERTLGVQLQRIEDNGIPMAVFPFDDKGGGIGGAVVYDSRRSPNMGGVHIYLPCPDLDAVLQRIGGEGGTVIVPKTAIGNHGWMAVIIDSEGNNVGLHQLPA